MGLSWATLRDRWQLFAGAAITVALAVALVQSSLLALVSAATADVPAGLPEIERLAVSEGYAGAISLLGITVAIAFFVSIFIVSSTFAFAVAQRRRDMALLRLVGASRRQVRLLLLAESVTIGAIGTIVGVPTGILVADLHDRMLIGLDLVPDGFRTEWRPWIIAVSAGVGVIVAALAAWGAAFRAGRVQPLEALRGSLRTDRVMTVWRWSIGLVTLGGAVAMMIIAPLVRIDGGLALSINVCLVLVVALAALAPLIVPPIAGLLAVLARVLVPRSALRELVSGNVRTSVRRTASTAAPIVVLVGLVVGLGGALAAMEDGMAVEATAVHTSNVIAVSHDDVDELIATTPGVEGYSTSTEAVVHVMASDDPGTEELHDTSVFGRTVDPTTYLTVNDLAASHGDLNTLADGAVAVTKELAGRGSRRDERGARYFPTGALPVTRPKSADSDLAPVPSRHISRSGLSGFAAGHVSVLPRVLWCPAGCLAKPSQWRGGRVLVGGPAKAWAMLGQSSASGPVVSSSTSVRYRRSVTGRQKSIALPLTRSFASSDPHVHVSPDGAVARTMVVCLLGGVRCLGSLGRVR